jgi:hypothetical protein
LAKGQWLHQPGKSFEENAEKREAGDLDVAEWYQFAALFGQLLTPMANPPRQTISCYQHLITEFGPKHFRLVSGFWLFPPLITTVIGNSYPFQLLITQNSLSSTSSIERAGVSEVSRHERVFTDKR